MPHKHVCTPVPLLQGCAYGWYPQHGWAQASEQNIILQCAEGVDAKPHTALMRFYSGAISGDHGQVQAYVAPNYIFQWKIVSWSFIAL